MALHKYLSVFNHAIEHGNKRNNKYHYQGIIAWHDFEGYTCYLGYQGLTMTIYFHNKFSYDSPSNQIQNEFEALVNKLIYDNASNG